MATIRSAVQMVDGMSPVIRSMTNALNICISSFETMQSVSSNAIDTSSFETARREINNAEMAMNQMEADVMNSTNAQNEFNHSMREGHNHANNLLDTIKGVAMGMLAAKVVMLGIEGVMNGLKASDQLVQTRARLGLINDGLRTTDELQNMIFQSAQRSRASYTDTANVVAKLGILAKNAFSSNEETVAFAEQMNKQFKIGGASIEEQTAGMYQLTQAMASGKLQGDEFRSIMENAPLLAQAIATYTGKSMGELRKMSAEGEITAGIIKKSLFSAAEETEARFAKMPKTIGEAWTSIKNQGLMAFQPVLLKINEVVNNPNFNILISQMVYGFSLLSIAILNVINIAANVGAFFQSNWGIIAPIIWGIIAALVVYNASLLINNILTGESVIAKAAHTIASWAETAAIIAMTAAQDGLNAALAMCPVTWIIIAIIALIAIFYLAVAAVNKFAGTSYSATGLIAGTFVALGTVIYNVIAYVWNVFAAYVEFFANVFTNPVEAVKRLHINLALTIIDSMLAATRGCDQFATNMANAIIEGINMAINAWNDFVDLLNSFGGIGDKLGLGKGSTLGYTASITSDLDSAKANLEGYLANKPDNYVTVPRMEAKDIGSAFNSGYAWGANAENYIGNMFSIPENQTGNGSGFNYDDLLNNAKDTADNTGKIKDKMDITDEDLKYLRDIAEQEVINRFTTAEIKVDMTNHNTIDNGMDIDGIIHHLGDGIYENLQTVAEGATYDV